MCFLIIAPKEGSNMLKIIIKREHGHTGFSLEHEGIYDDGVYYHILCNDIITLCRTMNELFIVIQNKDLIQTFVNKLREYSNDPNASSAIREFANKELAKWDNT